MTDTGATTAEPTEADRAKAHAVIDRYRVERYGLADNIAHALAAARAEGFAEAQSGAAALCEMVGAYHVSANISLMKPRSGK